MTLPAAALLGLGAALVALTLAALALDVPLTATPDHAFRVNLLVAVMAASAGCYFAAVRLVLRRPLPERSTWIVLGVAVALRAALLTTPPFLSSDIYRYVWDGRVQAAGINPYRYVPADPALASLRDATVYPLVNRAEYARTIYPPAAQLVFAAVGRVWDGVAGMRLAMVAFEAFGVACLLLLLDAAGLGRERALIYAWNPLPLWSFACDGHVDAVVVGMLALALLLRARHRDGWAGAALGAATLVKFLPAVVLPALLRGARASRLAIGTVAVIGAGYAVYSGAGRHVLGFLPSYGQEEEIASGTGFWTLAGLAELGKLPPWAAPAYLGLASLVVLALAAATLRRGAPGGDAARLCRDTGILGAATMVALSPHYPWYFAWLALPASVAPSRALIWLATAPLLLFLDPIAGDRFIWRSLVYVPAGLLLLAGARGVRAPAPQPDAAEGTIACPLKSP